MKKNRLTSPRMSDIASAAGVSLATVGRVLHKNGYVSEENRQKIEQLIAEMGYVPNKNAQGLKNRRSNLIGHLVVFNPNMLFAKISLAVNNAAQKQGFHVLTMTSHSGQGEEESQINELIGRQVDGVIITSNAQIPPTLIQKLVHLKIPVVMIERTYLLPGVDSVRVDDMDGACAATRYLLDMGHRRTAFIGMHQAHEVEKLRCEGYCEAVRSAGIPIVDEYIRLMPGYSVDHGYRAMTVLMNLPLPPTAVFATSDLFICGVLQYLYRHGKRVPDDLSLVGYDDTLSALLSPPITSMGLSLEDIGQNAIDLLLERMQDLQAPSQVVTIPTLLVNRNSVRRIV